MQGLELTLLLCNAFLVILIVVMYVHLAQTIRHDGIQIKLLQQQQKEAMSAAQRMGLAGLYVGKKDNLLVGKDAQIKDAHPFPLITSSRGNVDLSYLRNPNGKVNIPSQNKSTDVEKSSVEEVAENIGTSIATAVQNGATQVAAVAGLKDDHVDNTDSTTIVDPVQNGIVETEATEAFVGGNCRANPTNSALFVHLTKPAKK